MGSHRKRGSQVLTNMWRNLGILTGCHAMTETRHHNAAGTMARGKGTCGLHWPKHLHLLQITGSRVTEVQYQLPHQCHHGPIDLGAPGICTMADAMRSQQVIWKSICQSLRRKARKMPLLIRVGIGILQCIAMLGAKTHPSLLCYLLPTGLSWGVGKKFGDRCHLRWSTHHTGWTLQQCQGPRYFESRVLPTVNGWEGDCVRVGSASVKAPPNSNGFFPRMLLTGSHSRIEVWPLLQWAA